MGRPADRPSSSTTAAVSSFRIAAAAARCRQNTRSGAGSSQPSQHLIKLENIFIHGAVVVVDPIKIYEHKFCIATTGSGDEHGSRTAEAILSASGSCSSATHFPVLQEHFYSPLPDNLELLIVPVHPDLTMWKDHLIASTCRRNEWNHVLGQNDQRKN